MSRVRGALADLTDSIRWSALAAAWVLTLVAVAILTATDAPIVTTSMVLAGAGAVIALVVAGDALGRADDEIFVEAVLNVQASLADELRLQEMKTDALFSELRGAPTSVLHETKRARLPHLERSADPEMTKMLLAANLRRLRKQRGISVEQLAADAGLHSTEVTRLERGLREPRLRTVMEVAKALGVPVQDLIASADVQERKDAPVDSPPESS
jgi:DNA-binding XRE family transcriptional regulator